MYYILLLLDVLVFLVTPLHVPFTSILILDFILFLHRMNPSNKVLLYFPQTDNSKASMVDLSSIILFPARLNVASFLHCEKKMLHFSPEDLTWHSISILLYIKFITRVSARVYAYVKTVLNGVCVLVRVLNVEYIRVDS